MKITYDKPKVTNYWKKLPKTEFSSSVLFTKSTKKVVPMFLEKKKHRKDLPFEIELLT